MTETYFLHIWRACCAISHTNILSLSVSEASVGTGAVGARLNQ